MYGGAAGGGKSVALLMAALQYIDVPNYHALILRRTFKMLEKPGALIDLSKEWLMGTKAEWNQTGHRWTFPNGSTLTFGHMEHENSKYDYQGAAYQYVAYDELTQFTMSQYRYLFSRTRRRSTDVVPVRMRSASNPGGVGHQWVKDRFIDAKKRHPSARFIPATLDDNRGIDRDDYRRSLDELDPLTRDQLLRGDWDAIEGGRFQREWLRYYIRRGDYAVLPGESGEYIVKPKECPRFITVDPAASDKQSADWTVISVWALTPRGDLLWLDCVRVQLDVPDIVPRIQQVYTRYAPKWVGIEQVAANNAVYKLAKRTTMVVKPLSPGGRDKLVRASAAIVWASTGRLWLPADHPGFPLDAVENELLTFTGVDGADSHDDIVDTLSYAVESVGSLSAAAAATKPGVHSTW